MVMCFVPDCNHYSTKQMCSWFRFPKDPLLRRKWITNIRRQDREPTIHSLVCSCHFVNRDKNNLPTMFERNIDRRFLYTSPERKKKRSEKIQTVVNTVKNVSLQEIAAPGTSGGCRSTAVENVSLEETAVPETSRGGRSNVVENFSLEETAVPGTSGGCRTPSRTLSDEDLPGTSEGSKSSLNTSQTQLEKMSLASSAQQNAEMYFLKKENEELRKKLEHLHVTFSFEHIEKNDKLINMYTGIPNQYLFEALFSLFENIKLSYYLGWNVGNISKKDQLLITLMKLRLNLRHSDLACRFNCSSTTISNIVYTWIYALHEVMVSQLMTNVPSRNKNKSCLPSCFSTFTNCRIVLDCTEVKCVRPTSMDKQRLTYSSYKHMNTLKVLIGVAPNGVVTYVSDLYPGSTSDKKIVEDSGILEKMESGDLILADKGFLIKDLLPQGVSLNIPSFLTTAQFTPQQAIQTRTIARARIHVERAIRRIKCFSILDSIPYSLFAQSSMIIRICGALTNMQFPLITEVEKLYE